MTNRISLELKGTLWLHLLLSEKEEILMRMPNLLSDPVLNEYRFIKTEDGTWSIFNAMTLPLATKRMVL